MKAEGSKLKAAARSVLRARDRFWSGVWWTEWRLRRNEQLLTDALERFGEDSMLVRQLTERHRKLEKGVKYWRPSDAVVVRALEASERAGVARSDLRVLALNRDVVRVRDKVQVRRGWLSTVLAISALAVFLATWLLLIAQILSAPIGWEMRVAGAGVVTFLFWLIWPGWGLYTVRPLCAAAQVGETVERIAELHKTRSASVSSIEAVREPRR